LQDWFQVQYMFSVILLQHILYYCTWSHTIRCKKLYTFCHVCLFLCIYCSIIVFYFSFSKTVVFVFVISTYYNKLNNNNKSNVAVYKISSIHNYHNRGKRNLYFTTTETTTGKKALTHKGCILWNKFPESLKTIKSVAVFKHTLCPKKSKPNTMYHKNVKSECILCKFCMLYSEVFCEICTKFHLKILSDSRVTFRCNHINSKRGVFRKRSCLNLSVGAWERILC